MAIALSTFEAIMDSNLHDALTEALECVKTAGLIRRYSLTWSGRSEASHIVVWKATDTSDQALRRAISESLAGLAAESQITINHD
jgi:hypothetical protein